jgi:sugar lactone lactonase YvrE
VNLLLIPLLALAQTPGPTISTLVGTGVPGSPKEGAANIDTPFGVVRGPDGAVWFTEYEGQRISRVDRDGTLHTFAGTGQTGYSGDGGPAAKATFNLPHELRFDQAGNLFITDMKNHVIRRVDARTRVITTFAGTGTAGFSGDGGPAARAKLNQPHSLQFDPTFEHLYICDTGNHVIRRVSMKTGTISTFAGTGKPGQTPDGSPISGTPLNGPRSMDFDAQGRLWLVTREGNQVLRFDLKAGTISLVAGTGKKGFTGNGGPAKDATLSGPKGIAIAPNGNVYLADTESHTVRMIDVSTGTLKLVAGTGEEGDGPEGDPLRCKLARLHGLFVDKDGSLLIADSESHRIRLLRP